MPNVTLKGFLAVLALAIAPGARSAATVTVSHRLSSVSAVSASAPRQPARRRPRVEDVCREVPPPPKVVPAPRAAAAPVPAALSTTAPATCS
jgi:hypothetical protein